ncbi:MAG: S8 family serine peptidase, partial [Planctomycetota bacterium]
MRAGRLLALTSILLVFATAVTSQESSTDPWFVVLGETQLIDGAKAFPAFAKSHRKGKRSEIRAEVIERLKKIAEREQPKLLKALGDPGDVRRLWIVNAVVVRLPKSKVEEVSKLDGVKAVFPAGPAPFPGDAGKVIEVLEPAPRGEFSTKGKQIGWHLEMLRVPQVWKKYEITGEGVVVASIDQGANYLHQDLRGNVWINEKEVPNNGKDDDGNGLTDDVYGYDFARMKCEVRATGARQHGSWTSCLIVGDGTGGTITGVAPRARLMPLMAMG